MNKVWTTGLVLPPPGHLLAPVDQDVEVDVPGGVDVVLGGLAELGVYKQKVS